MLPNLPLSASRPVPPVGFVPPIESHWQCDLEGDVLTWSAGVFELFGLPRDVRPRRRDVVAMYLPESRRELEALRDEAIATGSSFTFEAQIRRTDESLRWIRISADRVWRGGQTVQLYGTKLDITAEIERVF